jgi:DNA-binding transcriptional LysR family regulator
MTLEQLRIFVAVADCLHVTRAAQSLNITQSAASASIAALENRHGMRLFHRIGRRIELTEAGRSFLPEARAVLARAAKAELALTELSGLQRGSLTLHASQTIANYWLPARLHAFRSLYPGIALHLTIANTAEVGDAVGAGEADLGFIEGDIDNPLLAQIPVPGDRLMLVVGAGHPWATAAQVTAADLTQTPWVLRESGSGTRQKFEAGLRALGVDPAAINVTLELPSNEAVRFAVEAGAGATVLSSLAVAAGLRSGNLKAIPLPFPERDFIILRHGDRYFSKAEAALIALVRNAISQ